MNRTISVCMTAYKYEAFIRQATEGVFAQNVDFLIERIFGDDCSPDGTVAICEEFARRDARVRLQSRDRNLELMPNFIRTLLASAGEHTAICEGVDCELYIH